MSKNFSDLGKMKNDPSTKKSNLIPSFGLYHFPYVVVPLNFVSCSRYPISLFFCRAKENALSRYNIDPGIQQSQQQQGNYDF